MTAPSLRSGPGSRHGPARRACLRGCRARARVACARFEDSEDRRSRGQRGFHTAAPRSVVLHIDHRCAASRRTDRRARHSAGLRQIAVPLPGAFPPRTDDRLRLVRSGTSCHLRGPPLPSDSGGPGLPATARLASNLARQLLPAYPADWIVSPRLKFAAPALAPVGRTSGRRLGKHLAPLLALGTPRLLPGSAPAPARQRAEARVSRWLRPNCQEANDAFSPPMRACPARKLPLRTAVPIEKFVPSQSANPGAKAGGLEDCLRSNVRNAYRRRYQVLSEAVSAIPARRISSSTWSRRPARHQKGRTFGLGTWSLVVRRS